MQAKADLGLIGLAVMGQNLVLNFNDHGYRVSVFNRTASKTEAFMEGPAKGTDVMGTYSLEELLASLKRPRKLMMMVQAGPAVDSLIEQLLPHLEPGDILIDGGNSLFTDTMRRHDTLTKQGILYLGVGISGGEEGARYGPSMMPGGNPKAWPEVKEMFQAISAKADTGEPCCDWVGEGGAGHYVKMVHNGIEYGDMQLICESYDLMKQGMKLHTKEIGQAFASWNRTELDSYLIEITSHIFQAVDEKGQPLVEQVLDVAGQKGTGKWTVQDALQQAIPLTLIAQAVFARFLSACKDERVEASRELSGPDLDFIGDKEAFLESIRQALYASKIVSYAQGFMLMRKASLAYNWNLNFGGCALMWRGGCIIRSRFLGKIKEAYDQNPQLHNLLLDPFFKGEINRSQRGWREVVAESAKLGISIPCFSSALAFFDGYRREKLPANLLQAQRDYFGAHTYERVDEPRGQFFHTEWLQAIPETEKATS